jgi:uncharacterized protein YjbJ (UPF0337 family)
MENGTVNYSLYSANQLREILGCIDAECHPINHANLKRELAKYPSPPFPIVIAEEAEKRDVERLDKDLEYWSTREPDGDEFNRLSFIQDAVAALPELNDHRPGVAESRYYAWKFGSAGVLPALIFARPLVQAGVDSVTLSISLNHRHAFLESSYTASQFHSAFWARGTSRRDHRRLHMSVDKDSVKGRVKRAVGSVQEAAGKVTGNRTQEAKGKLKKAVGSVQGKWGDEKSNAKDRESRR